MALKGGYYHSLLPHEHNKKRNEGRQKSCVTPKGGTATPCCTTCSHSTQGTAPQAGVLQHGPKGCVEWVFPAHLILWQLHHSQIIFSSTFHHKLRVQIVRSCSPTVVHSNTFSILWWETSSQNPLSLWETPGEHQELRKRAAGIIQDLSKKKSESQTRINLCFSTMDDSGDYRLFQLPEQPVVAGGPSAAVFATATRQARKSKQKPPSIPQGQIWQEKQH